MEHIAILKQPFFDMVLSGEKTIESRWSMNKTAPYNKISVGDKIYFKQSGEPVTAFGVAKKVKFYELSPQMVQDIRLKYGKEIWTDKFEDWQGTKCKRFCTLIWLGDVQTISPIEVERSFGNGWKCLYETILG